MAQELERVQGGTGMTGLPAERSLNLSANKVLDLSGLTDDQVAELKRQHVAGMIDLGRKAEEAKIDAGALSMNLATFNDEAAKASQANISMTLTHTQTSRTGRTEIVIGNTERAAAGKVSTSAAGLPDKTMWIAGIIAIVAIVLALIATRH